MLIEQIQRDAYVKKLLINYLDAAMLNKLCVKIDYKNKNVRISARINYCVVTHVNRNAIKIVRCFLVKRKLI